MIEFLDNDPILTHSHSLTVTYTRRISITYGNYPFIEDIHNLIIEIKNNISEKESYASNVKAGKTKWEHFINNNITTKFINFCINKHVLSNSDLFKYFYERHTIVNAWGNELKKGDYVVQHIHDCYHCILYLTEGEPLILPELNMKIIPKAGDYYFFPPYILHGVNKSTDDKNRYNLVMNIKETPNWDKKKYIYEMQNKK